MSDKLNPLLHPWTGPFQTPDFSKIEVRHFQPALEFAMSEHMRELDLIAANSAPPSFENTISSFELSGQTFARVAAIYGIWSANLSTDEFQEMESVMEPKIAAYEDAIIQHELLFSRIEAVYKDPNKTHLTTEQQRLVWLHYTDFVRAGARLSALEKTKLSAINQELAGLFTKFSQNILADEEKFITVTEVSELAGLPSAFIDAARVTAEQRGAPGKWAFINTRSSVDPLLTYAENRELRKRVWQMFIKRGDNDDGHDNKKIISRILELRLERARMLGYQTHAHWALEVTMAKTPEAATKLLTDVWGPATNRVLEEVADMQHLANRDRANVKIEPWDYRYYMEKVRKERFDLDDNDLTPYLQLDKLRDSMFFVANQLFNLTFQQVDTVSVFHADVRVWEVSRNGAHIGLFYFDPFARTGKRSGAWMTDYREQHNLEKVVRPIVSNNSNFVKGKPGEPTLISWDDATTLFHEFGHALHGLMSNVTYPSLSGTNVVRDYVEFPSQLLEHWLSTPEVLNRFAIHYKTHEPIPSDLIAKLKLASTFNQGFATTEYLASALMDMTLHLTTEHPIDAATFEKVILSEYKMPNELVMRHRTPQFMHIFSDDDYAAGYYSYLWADVITADAFNHFSESKGPYDKAVAQSLLTNVLSAGNTIDPSEGYRKFRGKDPDSKALLTKRGFC